MEILSYEGLRVLPEKIASVFDSNSAIPRKFEFNKLDARFLNLDFKRMKEIYHFPVKVIFRECLFILD